MGWVVWAGGELKAGYTIHKETDSSSVSPVGHINSHSRHGRPRRSLAAVPIHPVVDRRDLAGLEKDHL